MLLFFDTNILATDFRLESAPFRTLFAALPHLNAQAWTCPVVVDELVHRFSIEVDKLFSDARMVRKRANRLLGRSVMQEDVEDPSRSELATEYRSFIMQKLEDSGVQIAEPSEELALSDLLERAIVKRRPFDNSGRGFVDAVIWHHFIDLMKWSEREGRLFSADGRAFLGPEDRLHADLQEDLRQHEIDPSTVTVESSLKAFNSNFVYPLLDALRERAVELERGTTPFADKAENGLVVALSNWLVIRSPMLRTTRRPEGGFGYVMLRDLSELLRVRDPRLWRLGPTELGGEAVLVFAAEATDEDHSGRHGVEAGDLVVSVEVDADFVLDERGALLDVAFSEPRYVQGTASNS